jgi:hypothetical protein
MDAAPRKPRTGERTFRGQALDVREAAALLGTSEKTVRGMISRQLVPYRRLNARIIFLRTELAAWLETLPGVTLDEARMNQEARQR